MAVDKNAEIRETPAARVTDDDVAPIAGLNRCADGAHDQRVDGEAIAEGDFDLAVDETNFATFAVRRIGGRTEMIDVGKQCDVAGIFGVGFEPESERLAGLGGEIEFGGGNSRCGFFESGAPAGFGDFSGGG